MWQVQDIGHFFIRVARVGLFARCQNVGRARSKMRGGFGGNFLWQAQYSYLVNLDDILKGSKASFCETVVMFDFGHDDDSVWQVQHFGCLGLIFRAHVPPIPETT